MKTNHRLSLLFVLQLSSSVNGFTPLQQGRNALTASYFTSPNVMSVQRHSKVKNDVKGKNTALHASPFDIASAFYTQALLSNPLETKLLTGGILAMAGDAIAQSRDEGDYDVKRAGAFVSFDILYRALQCSLFPEIIQVCDGHYLASLTSVIPAVEVNREILATMEQTMANQFLVIPFIYYPVFFSLTGYMQGLSIDATIERVSTTIVPLLKRNWAFWIPVQYFQFGYVDEPLQIPFLCVVGLAWTFILSIVAGSVKSYETEERTEEVVIVNGDFSYNNKNPTLAVEKAKEEEALIGKM